METTQVAAIAMAAVMRVGDLARLTIRTAAHLGNLNRVRELLDEDPSPVNGYWKLLAVIDTHSLTWITPDSCQ
jgi:hypothetical protein